MRGAAPKTAVEMERLAAALEKEGWAGPNHILCLPHSRATVMGALRLAAKNLITSAADSTVLPPRHKEATAAMVARKAAAATHRRSNSFSFQSFNPAAKPSDQRPRAQSEQALGRSTLKASAQPPKHPAPQAAKRRANSFSFASASTASAPSESQAPRPQSAQSLDRPKLI